MTRSSLPGDESLLGLAVPDRDDHVLVDRQNKGLCLHPPKRRGEVTVAVTAHVALPPLPGLTEQVVGIIRQERAFQEADQEVLQGREPQPSPHLLPVELGREAHQPPHAGVPAQPEMHLVGGGIPSRQAGSDLIASLKVSTYNKPCGVVLAVPAIGAARLTMSGNRTAHS